jgi:hypothetical protein
MLFVGVVAVRAGFRLVEFAQFQKQDGGWAFSVFVYDRNQEPFKQVSFGGS